MYTLNVNGINYNINADGNTPLLWVLSDVLGLTGTKYGCGIKVCGACTVLIDGQAERSCSHDFFLSKLVGRKITTIEGLSPNGDSSLCVCGTYQRINEAVQSIKRTSGPG